MNHHQIDKTVMYQTVNLILNEAVNKAIWSALPAFVRGQTAHDGSLNILSALAQAQGTPLTGITHDKDRLQRSVVNRALIVAGAAGTYAFETENLILAAKFAVNPTAFAKLRDSLLDDAAQLIHDEAQALVTADAVTMTDFNLTPAMLVGLQSAITAYSATVGTPRAAVADRAGITKAIADEIDRADDNLKNRLDRLMLQFQAEHPAFFTTYQSARKIVDAGGRKAREPETPPAPVA